MRQVEPGVYLFSRASIYQYLLVEDSTAILIDTGLSLFADSLLRELGGVLPGRHLDSILITHADGDHTGGIQPIRRVFQGKIGASEAEAAAMRKGRMSRPVLTRNRLWRLLVKAALPIFNTPPVEIDSILTPGQSIPVLGGLQVLDSAGHTPGHLSFFLPKQRILFAGDSIVERNHVPSPAIGYNCWNEELSRRSFERQMAVQPLHLCCGHSYFKLNP